VSNARIGAEDDTFVIRDDSSILIVCEKKVPMSARAAIMFFIKRIRRPLIKRMTMEKLLLG